MDNRVALGSFLVLLMAQGSFDAGQEIRGRIVDAQGKPAAGARVFRGWSFPDPSGEQKDAQPTPWGIDDLHKPLVADERGEFAGAMKDDKLLFAIDAAGKAGVLVPIDPAHRSAQLEVKLEPLVEVRGRFDVKAAGELPEKTALWFSSPQMAFLAVCFSDSREVRVWLPPGDYGLWYSTDAVNLYSMLQLQPDPLKIAPGQGAIDLGAFELDLPLVVHPQGVVLDAEGKPVPGADIGGFWAMEPQRAFPFDGFRSEASGRFLGKVEVYDLEKEQVLFVLDGQREHGALAFWSPQEAEKTLELRLEPAIRVHGSLTTAGSAEAPSWTNVYASFLRKTSSDADGAEREVRFAQSTSEQARFEFRLPPGRYRLNAYGLNTKDVDVDLELTADKLEVDLGVIELPQTIIARNIGKEALPLHVTDARGVAKETKLADFRGKWVLLEFWGWW